MISKLNIDLFDSVEVSEDKYNSARANYIADYYKGPAKGEAEWNRKYPNGYRQWRGNQVTLTAYGQQEVINKINEIAEKVNAIEERYFL